MRSFREKETEPLHLRPASLQILDSPASSASPYRVKIDYVIPDEKILRPICETQWQFNPATRMVIFVFNEHGENVPRVMGFSAFRIPAPDKPASP